ncbi:MAG: hypothetical protein WA624_05310 [Methylocella sp.]
MIRFFDEYSRFYQTTGTLLKPNRFQQRWRMIIDRNGDLFQGARVLDLASHDGRWSFAALKAGAEFVEGVEGRPELVRRALENFAFYSIPTSAYRFTCQDVVKYLGEKGLSKFDVVLNLGFFYHTLKHLVIVEDMVRTGAKTFIFDTVVNGSNSACISVSMRNVNSLMNAIDHLNSGTSTVPIGAVSRTALKLMLEHVGYDCIEIDWHELVTDFTECEAYEARTRGTFIATRRIERISRSD